MRALFRHIRRILSSIIYAALFVVTLVLMTLIYFTMIPLTILFAKLSGRRFFPRIDPDAASYWTDRKDEPITLDDLRKQF